jgi:hypothetical protein
MLTEVNGHSPLVCECMHMSVPECCPCVYVFGCAHSVYASVGLTLSACGLPVKVT